jgi:hypothetical protein
VPETDQRAPSVGPSDAPRIELPKNLAQTLQFLGDDDLETLRASVEIEFARRLSTSTGPVTRKVSAAEPATPLAADTFVVGAASQDANDRIVYNSATGALSYDADGSGAGGGIQFSLLNSELSLGSVDFLIV